MTVGYETHCGTGLAGILLACLLFGCEGGHDPVGTPRTAQDPHEDQAGRVDETPIFNERAAALGLDFRHFNGMTGAFYMAEMLGAGNALLDYDNDGDLDVFLVQGARFEGMDGATAEDAPTDRLYRNDLMDDEHGNPVSRFTDVTEESGLRSAGNGMGVAVADFDSDGWPDIYVLNLGKNRLFRNRGDGTFADVTTHSGTGDPGWGVSASFLDYDRDGWLDLFVGNYVDFSLQSHKICLNGTGAKDYCGPLAYAEG